MVLCFTGCASNKVVTESATKNNNIKTEEKLRFIDWKYKGFGKNLPLWVEPAVDNDIKALKKLVPDLNKASSIKILIGTGENSDQAEQKSKELVSQLLEQDEVYIFYDSFWVLENKPSLDMPYISLYIYYKN